MQANRNELIDVLRKVQPALSTKGIIEEMGCVMFSGGMIYGYNDKLCIGHRSPAALDGCSVPAAELLKILQGIDDEQVELAHNAEKRLLSIGGGAVQAKLKTLPSELVQSIPDASAFTWDTLPADFLDGLRLCMFAASRDMSVAFLNCVNVDEDLILATDNFRISRYQMTGAITPFKLPLAAAVELDAIGGFTEYAVGAGWVFFRTTGADVIFCARAVEADYPDTSALFDIAPGEEFDLPLDIRDGIKVCTVLSDQDAIDRRIKLTMTEAEVICRGEGSKGWVEHRVAGSGLPEVEFDVNPVFLDHVLQHSTTARVLDGKMVFRSGAFTHIMALPE